jgi:pimeloyl-ACP methyl ester carboxylesterase
MLEEIASHGYIVFGVDHTYDAFLTTLPNGQVIQAIEAATPETAETLAMRVADVRFVLDQIAALNTSQDALAGHLDLTQLGLIGHSYGGATVAEVCREDVRCKAVAVIDVPLRGAVASVGLAQPILLMDSEVITCDQFVHEVEMLSANPPFGLKDLCEAIKADRKQAAEAALKTSSAASHISIVGTRHNSYTDLPFLAQQQPALTPRLGGIVSIEAERGWRVSCDYVLAFFGKHLRGEVTTLLDGTSAKYPDVVFESAR